MRRVFWLSRTKQKQAGYLALIRLARRALEECIDLLGFSAPDRM